MTQTSATADPRGERLTCDADAGFVEWMSACGGSLAVSTYQAGKLFLVGWNGRQVSFLARNFDRPMGLDVQGPRMALVTTHAIQVFANAPNLAPLYLERGRYDALYLPRALYVMPDLAVHDLAYAGDTLWVVNTQCSCIATLSLDQTFVSHWQPPFIDSLAAEDRCHLNGMAMVEGRPAYVTMLSQTNTRGGWREHKKDGGIVMDMAGGEVLLRGLAMPHSPRWHDGRLWVLNSGHGQLLRLDGRGGADVVCELPGYLRGLCFVNGYALIGLCKIRESNVFGGMPVQQRHAELLCGVAVVSLRSGKRVGTLSFTSGCTEIYDIRFLAGIHRPNIVNMGMEEARKGVDVPGLACWLPSDQKMRQAAEQRSDSQYNSP